jgi:hypothetical protein
MSLKLNARESVENEMLEVIEKDAFTGESCDRRTFPPGRCMEEGETDWQWMIGKRISGSMSIAIISLEGDVIPGLFFLKLYTDSHLA